MMRCVFERLWFHIVGRGRGDGYFGRPHEEDGFGRGRPMRNESWEDGYVFSDNVFKCMAFVLTWICVL